MALNHKTWRRIARILLLAGGPLFLMLMVSGCQRTEFNDLKIYVEKARNVIVSKYKKPIVSLPKAHVAFYQAGKVRTPFGEQTALGPIKPKANVNPLQSYPVNTLKLVGTVTEHNKTTAYVKTPDNMLYQVKVGDLIGIKNDHVQNISQDKIDILEIENQNNTEIQHVITLQLKDQH